MRLLFCTSDKIGARLIRLVTWSEWSHVAVIDGEEVIEAVWPRVRVTPLAEVLAEHTDYVVIEIDCPDAAAGIAWARSKVGKPYDWRALLGMLLHRDWQDDARWYCSELANGAILNGGKKLFRDIVVHTIYPQHLWMLSYPSVHLGAEK